MSSTPPASTSAQTEVRIRRAPRIPVFLILGALLGFIVTLALTSSFPTDPTVGFPATFGYFLLYGIPAGVVLGALVAIVLDRVSVRRAKTVSVEHTIVDPLPFSVQDADLPQDPPTEEADR
jgi:hypothetical protein